MTAIILANNPPPLKQTQRKSISKSSGKGSPNSLSPQRAPECMDVDEETSNSDKNEVKGVARVTGGKATRKFLHRSKLKSENGGMSQVKGVKLPTSSTDDSDAGEEEEETGEEEKDEEEKEGNSDGEDEQSKMDSNSTAKQNKEGEENERTEVREEIKKKKGRRRNKEKKGGKAVNIPSIEYPVRIIIDCLPVW